MVRRSTTTKIFGHWRAEQFSRNRSSSSAIRAAWFDVDLDEIAERFGQTADPTWRRRLCRFAGAGRSGERQKFSRHDHLQLCSACCFSRRRERPPMERAEKAVKRFHNQTPAQRASEYLGMPAGGTRRVFETGRSRVSKNCLNRLPIPNRPGALVPPTFPPYFQTEDRERRARMWEKCAEPGSELAKRIQQIWIPLFTPPPPPTYIPKDVFMAKMKEGHRETFCRCSRRSRKNSRARRQNCFCPFSAQRRIERARRQNHAAPANLGSVASNDARAREFIIPIFRSCPDSIVRSGRT